MGERLALSLDLDMFELREGFDGAHEGVEFEIRLIHGAATAEFAGEIAARRGLDLHEAHRARARAPVRSRQRPGRIDMARLHHRSSALRALRPRQSRQRRPIELAVGTDRHAVDGAQAFGCPFRQHRSQRRAQSVRSPPPADDERNQGDTARTLSIRDHDRSLHARQPFERALDVLHLHEAASRFTARSLRPSSDPAALHLRSSP
jgi:hypothetical protein